MDRSTSSSFRRALLVTALVLVVVLVARPVSSVRGQVPVPAPTLEIGIDPRQPDHPTGASQSASTAPRFGIQFYGGTIRNETLVAYVRDAGGQVVRWPLSWASVEPNKTTPEHYDWSSVDSAVANAVDHDVELILTIAGQPSWAAQYAMGPVYDTADLVQFVGALVDRYRGDVRYFELYNEPDNYSIHRAEHGGYGYFGNNGETYAEYLKELYPVVKAANPEAQLVFGGIALDWCVGGGFDCEFLDDVLEACQGHACFDVMNFHYFPYYRSNWESYGPDIIGKTNYIRGVMADHGFGDRSLISSEINWEGGTQLGSDELQSRYVAKGYTRGLAADLDTVVWFWLLDGGDPKKPGLLDDHRQPKPSYQAYETMTTMLGDAVFQRALTPEETGSSQLVGYRFDRAGRRLDVVWTEDRTPYNPHDDPVLPLTVSAPLVRVVDKFGNDEWLSDEDDGVADGQVTLDVGGSPLYVEYDEPLAAGFSTSSPDWLGQTTAFTNTTTGAAPITYTWDFGDGATSGAESPTHTYTEAGVYTVVLTATDASESDVATDTVTVYGPPRSDFVASPVQGSAPLTVAFTAAATTVPPGDPTLAYLWHFGDGSTSVLPNPEYTYEAVGTYTVTLEVTNAAGTGVEVKDGLIAVGLSRVYLPLIRR